MIETLPSIKSFDVEENLALLYSEASEFDQLDLSVITKAYRTCVETHKKQKRKDKAPYYTHPLTAALYYLKLFDKPDTASVAATLLHDTIEDSKDRKEKEDEIRNTFGDEIYNLVDGLTNIRGSDYDEASSFGKLMIEMIKDYRIMIIKLCDRLHNMVTLGVFNKEKREEISEETLEFFVPAARWIGNWKIKQLLEDIAFSFLDQEKYLTIRKQLDERFRTFGSFINDLEHKITEVLNYYKIDYTLTATHKTPYEIYQLSERENIPVEQIDNFYSMVISLNSNDTPDCYHVLGILYKYFTPIDFTDYISYPKFNLFQSLLLHLYNNDGRKIEVLIRTDQMDEIATKGFLALYEKTQIDALNMSISEIDHLYQWMMKLIDSHGEEATQKIWQMVKNNFYHQEINVFYKGEQYRLPQKATILDLAFMIDDKKALYFDHALVNSQKKPYFYKLSDKETVEIAYSDEKQISRDWSKNVLLFKAILAIDKYFDGVSDNATS
jgi:GTP diphosphokinase / guanosine-3',5'-bis(diphosphate) 3'-diphosphatase